MKEVDNALDVLKENIFSGEQVPRKQWPPKYLEKYGIPNLYRYGLGSGYRMPYTLLKEETGLGVFCLELLSHKEYERLFRY